MPFNPLPDGAQFVLEYGTATFRWTITLHAVKPGFTEDDVIAADTAIEAAWQGLANKPICVTQMFQNLTVYDQRSSLEPVYHYPVGGAVGSIAGEEADRQTAVVVTLRSDVRGRSGRGRIYWGGVGEGVMTNGTFQATYLTNVALWITALLNALTGTGWTPVIKSQQVNGAPLVPAVGRPIIGSEIRNNVPGSQNRRNDRP